jgi:hypothetical protein
MTECNTDGIHFASLGRRAIIANFNGGRLTTDGGLLLLRQMNRQLGLTDALSACILDPRDPAMIEHDQATMIAQRVLAIACAYEDLNDHGALRHDPALQIAVERPPDDQRPLASPPTLCRLENRVMRKAFLKMHEVFLDQFVKANPTPPKELILDFDATDDPVHGQQEGRFFHGYYDGYCFLPLYVFGGDELLVAYLRPSNIDPALHTGAILKLLVQGLRQVWPNVKITLRGDSGFCRWRLMRWCDRHDVQYILGLAKNEVLKRLAEPWVIKAQQQFADSGQQKQRVFGQVQYAAETWDRLRTVIVKAECLKEGPNLRFIVTNLEGDPQALYDEVYCQRGEMENRIKEQQLALFADRTSCHKFLANQFRLMLSAAAYILVQALRRTALAGTELAEAQVDTIRLKLLKIAARVMISVRRVVFQLASGHPSQALFRLVADRLMPPRLASG